MTALTVVMISGQSRRSSSHDDSNGGSDGFKDSDGFNDDHGFAGICNGDGGNEYDGGMWDCANAIEAQLVGAVTAAVQVTVKVSQECDVNSQQRASCHRFKSM